MRLFACFLLAVLVVAPTRAQDDVPVSVKSPLRYFLQALDSCYTNDLQKWREKGEAIESFRFDRRRDMDSLAAIIRVGYDEPARQAAAFAWLFLCSRQPVVIDTTIATMALQVLPSSSSLWAYYPEVNPTVMGLTSSLGHRAGIEKYFEAMVERHPSPRVQEMTLYELAEDAFTAADTQRVERYQALFAEKFPASLTRRFARRDFSFDKSIAVGKPVPDFLLFDEDDNIEMRVYSNASFRGKYYLLYFWSTASAVSRAELPFLREVYARYRTKGLEIMGLAMEPVDSVRQFRSKNPIPWISARSKIGPHPVQTFEVNTFPTIILVNPKGTIIALAEDLRGKKLLKTLQASLGVSAPAGTVRTD